MYIDSRGRLSLAPIGLHAPRSNFGGSSVELREMRLAFLTNVLAEILAKLQNSTHRKNIGALCAGSATNVRPELQEGKRGRIREKCFGVDSC